MHPRTQVNANMNATFRSNILQWRASETECAPEGFELFVSSSNCLRTSAPEGRGGRVRVRVRGREEQGWAISEEEGGEFEFEFGF